MYSNVKCGYKKGTIHETSCFIFKTSTETIYNLKLNSSDHRFPLPNVKVPLQSKYMNGLFLATLALQPFINLLWTRKFGNMKILTDINLRIISKTPDWALGFITSYTLNLQTEAVKIKCYVWYCTLCKVHHWLKHRNKYVRDNLPVHRMFYMIRSW